MESMTELDLNHGAVENKERGAFYDDAVQYWAQVPATVDGMLGGYGFITNVDIQGSNLFLKQLFRLKVSPGKGRALDCGAGIGRITKNLLLKHFHQVDLVEQNPAFVAQARASLESHKNMGNFFCSGLQDFIPEPAAYDVIWCQWVLGHLKDDDLIAFLQGCILGLKVNGVLVVKENTTTSGKLDEDPTDSSVTRPLDHLCGLLQQAGLRCVKQKRQENFPHGLYPVYMIATRPSLEKLPNSVVLPAKDIGTSVEMEVTQDGGIANEAPGVSLDGAEFKGALNASLSKDNDQVLTLMADTSKSVVEIGEASIEPFEEEASAFDCQVEYSSDDSTKTELSLTNSNNSLASSQINIYQTSGPQDKKEYSGNCNEQNAANDFKCDIT